MKELILIYDKFTVNPDSLKQASELIQICSHIDYIQKNLPKDIDIAWLDKENNVLELI